MAKQKLLYINPIGGLANRMRALAGGLALARDLEVMPRVIWCMNHELNARFDQIFLSNTRLNDCFCYPTKLSYSLLYSQPRKKNLRITALTLRRFGAAFLANEPEESGIIHSPGYGDKVRTIIKKGFDSRCSCFLQGGEDLYPYTAEEYRRLFIPSPQIASGVAQRMTLLGNKCVGVHIRRSDNKISIEQSPDSLFINEMKQILDRESDTRFYLATDSQHVKEKFSRLFGDKIIFSPGEARRDSADGIIEAATELFTLAGTQKILGSFYSSFSEAAALLGNIPLQQLSINNTQR